MFVKDALEAQKALETSVTTLAELKSNLDSYDRKIQEYEIYSEKLNEYISIGDIITRKNIALNSLNTKIQTIQTNCNSINKTLEQVEKDIQVYKQNEEAISSNKIVQ